MNILIFGKEEYFCSKVESRLFSSRLGHDLYTKILNETTSLYQKLAGFVPDIMICCADSFDAVIKNLIAKISNLSPMCKIIIVADKPDIKLYKWAMENGIFKIVEDKDNIHEIIECSAKADKLIASERAALSEQEEKDKFVSYASHKIKCELLRYVMHDYTPNKRQYEYPRIIDFEKYLGTSNLCVTVYFDWGNLDDYQRYVLIFDIEKYISDSYFAKLDIPSVFINDDTLCFIVNEAVLNENGFSLNYFRDLIHRAIKEKHKFSVGVSQLCDLHNAREGFAQSANAAMMSFYHGWNKIYFYEFPLVNIDDDIFECSKTILSSVKEGNFDSAVIAMENMSEKILKRHKYIPREVFTLMSNIAMSLCYSYGVKNNVFFNLFSTTKFITYKELHDTLGIVLNEVRTILDNTYSIKTTNRKINNILRYIDDNYTDKNLSVGTIASNNYLSRNYLCTLFKEKTGTTVNAYIIKLRIEKSCQLLEDKNKKLYDVAFESGFCDPNYFSTVFKKQMGCSPTEYRIRKGII